MSVSVTCPSCHEKNEGSLLLCKKCQTSLVGISREQYPPVQSKLLIQETTPPQRPIKSLNRDYIVGLFLFLLKAFGIACLIALFVSIIGWQFFGWNSGRQLSDGLFGTCVILATLGYYTYRSYAADSKLANAGDSEHTKLRKADGRNAYAVYLYLFLISVYIFGLSVLVSNIF